MSLWSLIVKVKGDNSGLKTTLNESEKQVTSFGSAIGKIGGLLKGAFAVTAIVAFGKKVIESSEYLSDKFNAALAGVKGSLFQFNSALASGNFRGFIDNLIEGYKKAKDLEEKLDALADKKAFESYSSSSLKYESANLQEIVKNQELGVEERQKAARRIQEIETQIKDNTDKINNEAFELEKKAWEDKNKMVASEAISLYETIDNLSSDIKDRLSQAFEFERGLFGKAKGTEMVMSGEGARGLLKGIPEDVIQSYGKYLQMMDRGETDIITKLFSAYENYNTAKTEAQLRYNGILRITSGLLNKEISDLERVSSPSKVPVPGLGSARTAVKGTAKTALEKDNFGLAGVNDELNSQMNRMQEILSSGRDMAVSLGSQLIEGLGEALASGDLKEVGKQLLSSFAGFLSQFGKMLIAYGIAHTAFYESLIAGPVGGVRAIAAGTAALLAAGAIKGLMANTAKSGAGAGNYSANNTSMQNIKVHVVGKIKGKDIGIAMKRS